MINVECPSCSAPYELDERRLPASGMNMRCPKCGESFRVTKDGVGPSAPAAPKPPAVKAPPAPPAPPARKRAPIAPDFGGVDLPAPKRSAPAVDDLGLDLPAPKRAAPAPAVDDLGLDLPAPKRAAPAPAVDDLGLDLPAPKRAAPAIPRPPAPPAPPASAAAGLDDLGLDLPAPKRAAPAAGLDDLGLDLPAPKRAAPPAVDDLGLDLPAPKRAAPADDLGLDLPAPKRAAPADDLGLDLPAPRRASPAGAADDLELDLPAPRKPGGGMDDLDLDLPMPRSGGVDLPAPRGAGLADLPAPRSGGVDLPAPRSGGADLPAVRGGLADLPAPSTGAANLPRPAAARGSTPFDTFDSEPVPDLDLPRPDAGASELGDFGELDLGSASAGFDSVPPGGGGLGGLPPLDLGGASDGDAGYGLGDLDLGAAPTPPTPAAPNFGVDTADELGGANYGSAADLDDLDDLDDLALPPPRDRGSADDLAGVGGMGYGDVDLGGDDDDDAGLEFDGLAVDDDLEDGELVVERDAMVAIARERKRAQREAEEKAADKPASKKAYKVLGALAAVLVLVGAGGAALSQTKYGPFGLFLFEQFLPEAGDAGRVRDTIQEAERQAQDDTYTGARTSLRTLASYRRTAGLNRELMTRSLLHESLFVVRFGDQANASSRASAIARRLEERGNDAPGIDLAMAANFLRNGSLSAAREKAQQAASAAQSDPYPELILGEATLLEGAHEEAAQAFRRALEKDGGARAQWGLARALIAASDPGANDAVVATLAQSPRHMEARIARARHLAAEGDWDGAVALAREAASLTPIDGTRLAGPARTRARALTLLGRLYASRGQRSRGREMFEQAILAAPDDVEALVGAGDALLLEGRARDALTRYTTLLEANLPESEIPAPLDGQRPYLDQARLGAAKALLAVERPQDARAYLMTLNATYPEDAEVVLWLGRVAQATSGRDEAIERFREAVRLAPDRYEAYMALAQLYFDADRANDAAAVLADAEEHVPMTADVRRLRGNSQVRLGNLNQAVSEFRAAIELDEHDVDSRFFLGTTLRQMGQLAAADAAFEEVSQRDPSYAGLALERGRVFEDRRQPARAVASYARALEESPDDVDLKLRLGAARASAGQLDEAETILREVLAERPRSAETLHFLGRVEFQRGHLQEASQLFGQAVSFDSSVGIFHAYAGWVALEQNELPLASQSAEAALRHDPTLALGLWVRGEFRVRVGQAREALDDLIAVINAEPDMLEAWASMGRAYDELGDSRQAIIAYQRAVNGRPSEGDWWYRLGRLQVDHGDSRGGATSLARATVIGGQTTPRPAWLPAAYRARAEAHRSNGERAAAIQSYRQYLESMPAGAPDRAQIERALLDLGAAP